MGWQSFRCLLNETLWPLHDLLPGDVILADCEFTIQDKAGMLCAQVKIHRGKNNLTWKMTLLDSYISRVRIHVERVIGMA